MRNVVMLAAALMMGCGDEEGDSASDTAAAEDTAAGNKAAGTPVCSVPTYSDLVQLVEQAAVNRWVTVPVQ